ncbi:hypothetical protein GTP44_01015 [Duganella sp. FT50W]|uniref:Mu-like prophage FluMu N-terminal domain-containing protein n=1 Tax=Duganella lactea TaxID=2692173 RepID=A0A6L8MD08_9BURK|nr:hypothetical protein [Duganella lactea]MYM80540.1 hypothetical protein [Duganella lactea]
MANTSKNPKKATAANRGTGGQDAPSQAKPAGQSAEQESAKTAQSIPGLEVSSTVDGYRRGGRAWTKAPTIVALSELTEGQVEQLEWDINIRVTEVDIPVAEAE